MGFIYTDDMMIWRHNDVIEECDLQTDFVSDWPQYARSRITFATTKCVRFFVVIWNTGVSSDQLYVCPDFVWLKFCVVQNPEMVQPGVHTTSRPSRHILLMYFISVRSLSWVFMVSLASSLVLLFSLFPSLGPSKIWSYRI